MTGFILTLYYKLSAISLPWQRIFLLLKINYLALQPYVKDEAGDNFVRLLDNCYYIVFFLLAHFAETPLFEGMGVLEWLTPEAIICA